MGGCQRPLFLHTFEHVRAAPQGPRQLAQQQNRSSLVSHRCKLCLGFHSDGSGELQTWSTSLFTPLRYRVTSRARPKKYNTIHTAHKASALSPETHVVEPPSLPTRPQKARCYNGICKHHDHVSTRKTVPTCH